MILLCLFLFAINFLLKGVYILCVPCVGSVLLRKKVNIDLNLMLLIGFAGWYVLAGMVFGAGLEFMPIMIPVAYLVGLNYGKTADEGDIVKVYLVLAWGMCAHVLLNFLYETVQHGGLYFGSVHVDFWSGSYSSVTGQLLNMTMFFPLLGYALIKRGKQLWIIPGLLAGLLYGVIAGSRSVLILLAAASLVSIITYIIVCKENRLKLLCLLLLGLVAVVTVGAILYQLNAFNIKTVWESSYLAKRFAYSQAKGEALFDTERWNTKAQYFSLIMRYPWGGSNMKEQVGLYAHDLWLDTWDYAGWGPTLLISVYMAGLVWRTLRFIKETQVVANKVLFMTYLAVLLMQLITEPILQGAPIFLMSACILDGMIARYLDSGTPEGQGGTA